MRDTEIKFNIVLDGDHIPTQIVWDATEKPTDGFEETKAIQVAIWDAKQNGALRVDLWTRDMEVGEMKRFAIESMGGLAETLLQATGDGKLRDIMIDAVKKMAEHVKQEEKNLQN